MSDFSGDEEMLVRYMRTNDPLDSNVWSDRELFAHMQSCFTETPSSSALKACYNATVAGLISKGAIWQSDAGDRGDLRGLRLVFGESASCVVKEDELAEVLWWIVEEIGDQQEAFGAKSRLTSYGDTDNPAYRQDMRSLDHSDFGVSFEWIRPIGPFRGREEFRMFGVDRLINFMVFAVKHYRNVHPFIRNNWLPLLKDRSFVGSQIEGESSRQLFAEFLPPKRWSIEGLANEISEAELLGKVAA